MADYTAPTITAAYPDCSSQSIDSNGKSIDALLTIDGLVTTGRGIVLKSWRYITANTGFSNGGTFGQGGTIDSNSELVFNPADNWFYQHTGTAPVAIPAAPDANWRQFNANNHEFLSGRNPGDGTAHNANDIAHVVANTDVSGMADFIGDEGEIVYVTDLYGGSFCRLVTTPQVVDGQTSTNITFEDERVFLLNSGKYLQFDDNLNSGLLRSMESSAYANYIAKMYERGTQIDIKCYGDSITYGQALANTAGATNKIGDQTGYGDGSTFQHWQYDASWPQVLQSEMNKYLSTDCQVLNLGYSGARAYSGYLMHRTSRPDGVSLIMYGTNETLFATSNGDSLAGLLSDPLNGVEAYCQSVKRFAIREILRGNTVILMSALNFAGASGWDGKDTSATKASIAYDQQLRSIAKELGLLVIDFKQEITNSYATNRITQDGVHPNEVGHSVIGGRLASPLLAGFKNVPVMTGGVKFIANSAISKVSCQGTSGVNVLSNGTSFPPPFTGSDPTTVSVTSTTALAFSFYAAEDDLIVWPEAFLNGATMRIRLSGGAEQSEYLLDGAIGKPVAHNDPYPAAVTASPAASKEIVEAGSKGFGQRTEPVYLDDAGFIHIASRGYHTISIESTAGGTVLLDGLSSLGYEDAKAVHSTKMCTFNGAGSVVEQKLKGIGSITRVDAGRYDVFFDPAAPDNYYSLSGVAMASNLGSGIRLHIGIPAGDSANVTPSKCRIEVIDTVNGNRTDAESIRLFFDMGI